MSAHPDQPSADTPPEVLSALPTQVMRARPRLCGRQKAAIVVRVLLAGGAKLPLSGLPEHLQAALTEQIGNMRLVDRETMLAVVTEFLAELEAVGLSFPGGIDGALSMLDGHISANAASRLRRLAGASGKADPWERVATFPEARLLPVLDEESVEVGAVMLSKLPVPRAAALLEAMPGERARALTQAMPRTSKVDPETARRIGLALAAQLEAQPPLAFDAGPAERVGAILNASPSVTREDVLEGLSLADPEFGRQVRKAIFTFGHIPQRVPRRAVANVMRAIDPETLTAALVAARAAGGRLADAVEYLLSNLPQRMAEAQRAAIAETPPVAPRAGEDAMAEVIAAIRQLEADGELVLTSDEDDAPDS